MNTPVVALAFPSPNPVPSRRREDSKYRAQRFGATRSLGESRLVVQDTFGYLVPANSPVSMLADAARYGGRVVKFTEGLPAGKEGGYPGQATPQHSDMHATNANSERLGGRQATSKGHTDPQGVEHGKANPKSQDGARYNKGSDKSKVKAGNYGKTNKQTQSRGLKEGTWIELPSEVPAVQLEMEGTYVKGNSKKGNLHAGRYFVLGIKEATDGKVVTLGRVSSLAKIGSCEEGRYLYNVLYSKVEESLQEADGSMSHLSDGGYVGKKTAKSAHPTKKTKREGAMGVTGGMAGASTMQQAESHQVTSNSVHGQGLKILESLGVIGSDKKTDKKPLSDAAQKLLAENADNAAKPIPEAVSVESAKKGSLTESITQSLASTQGLGGRLSGGPFDSQIDPNLNAKLAMMRQSFQTGANNMLASGIDSVNESQISESMGGASSMDPVKFAFLQYCEDNDIEPSELSEEEIEELIEKIQAEMEEDEDSSEDEEDVEEDDDSSEDEEGLFEDLEVGDVSKMGGMASLLKQRGYSNADAIASKLESGAPAEEWFGMTGGSLQDAKRLQWLFVQSRKKGHY